MKYVFDQRVLLAIVEGDCNVINGLEWHRKRDVVVPEPVILHVARAAKQSPSPGAMERWNLLLPVLPRMPWTQEVTEKLLALEPPDGVTSLDTAVVAHALAAGLEIVSTDVDFYAWMPDVGVTLCI